MTMHNSPALFSAHVPLELENAMRAFPTLGATSAHQSRSKNYRVIESSRVLESLYNEGFRIHSVQTSRVRDLTKKGFEKHLVRLRRVDAQTVNGIAPEVVMINSHDGSSAWDIFGGALRFVCENGLVIGDIVSRIKVKHAGDIASKVIDATYSIVRDVDNVLPLVDEMRAIELTPAQRLEFAEQAHAIRFPRDAESPEVNAPVSPLQLLTVRRLDDNKTDLWSTFNVVQENMTKGGLRGVRVNSQGRMRRTRLQGLNAIDGNVSANRALFNLAHDTWRNLKVAA